MKISDKIIRFKNNQNTLTDLTFDLCFITVIMIWSLNYHLTLSNNTN